MCLPDLLFHAAQGRLSREDKTEMMSLVARWSGFFLTAKTSRTSESSSTASLVWMLLRTASSATRVFSGQCPPMRLAMWRSGSAASCWRAVRLGGSPAGGALVAWDRALKFCLLHSASHSRIREAAIAIWSRAKRLVVCDGFFRCSVMGMHRSARERGRRLLPAKALG